MKKILLSVAVVIVFAIYAIHQRHEASTAVAIIRRKSPATSSQTGSSSASSANNNGSSSVSSSVSSSSGSSVSSSNGKYKDGTYTGDVADAFYGNVQVQAVVSGGKLASVNFLQYPHDNRTSVEVNSAATPTLAQEAIQAQSAKVDTVTGATQTSAAFVQSLASALNQAV